MRKIQITSDRVVSGSSGIRTYVNPHAYNPTPKKEKPSFKLPPITYKIGGAVVAIGLIVWLFLGSNIFSVKTITIKGDPRPETKDAVTALYGRNIFSLGAKKTKKELIAKQPGIKDIKILRGLPSTIIVQLVERNPALVWETQGKQYLVDKEGYVFKEGTGEMMHVTDGKNLLVSIGDRIVSTSFVATIDELKTELPRKTGLEIDKIIIPETTYQIEIATKDGPKLKLDTSGNISGQLADIGYIRTTYKDNTKKLIDVRVKGLGFIQ